MSDNVNESDVDSVDNEHSQYVDADFDSDCEQALTQRQQQESHDDQLETPGPTMQAVGQLQLNQEANLSCTFFHHNPAPPLLDGMMPPPIAGQIFLPPLHLDYLAPHYSVVSDCQSTSSTLPSVQMQNVPENQVAAQSIVQQPQQQQIPIAPRVFVSLQSLFWDIQQENTKLFESIHQPGFNMFYQYIHTPITDATSLMSEIPTLLAPHANLEVKLDAWVAEERLISVGPHEAAMMHHAGFQDLCKLCNAIGSILDAKLLELQKKCASYQTQFTNAQYPAIVGNLFGNYYTNCALVCQKYLASMLKVSIQPPEFFIKAGKRTKNCRYDFFAEISLIGADAFLPEDFDFHQATNFSLLQYKNGNFVEQNSLELYLLNVRSSGGGQWPLRTMCRYVMRIVGKKAR